MEREEMLFVAGVATGVAATIIISICIIGVMNL